MKLDTSNTPRGEWQSDGANASGAIPALMSVGRIVLSENNNSRPLKKHSEAVERECCGEANDARSAILPVGRIVCDVDDNSRPLKIRPEACLRTSGITAIPPGLTRTPHRIFTLIELLVVIAIIAILAAMLLPVLTKVKESGKQLLCLANEKQLALLVSSYTCDYGYYMPNNANTTAFPTIAWSWLLRNEGYLTDTMLYSCPASVVYTPSYCLEFRKSGGTTAWTYNYANYGINAAGVTDDWFATGGQVNAQNKITPAKADGINNPSQKVLFADSRMSAALDRPFFIIDAYGLNGRIISRHSGKANIAWVDGHADAVVSGEKLQYDPLALENLKRN